MATFVQDGHSIDYTPAAAVAVGDVVVQGSLVGVARTPIAANALGSLAVRGVFDFAKAAGAGTAIAVGKAVYWDAAAKVATETAQGNTLMGKTIAATVDADTKVRVRLSQ